MKKDKLLRNLLDKAAAEYLEIMRQEDGKRRLVATNTREQHFAQNYKKR